MTTRTRMAPSPTGEYHVGHIATLLKNYAFAKKHDGQFILRIEDTDQERKVEGAVEKILSVIKEYGLDWDEGPDKGGPHAPYTQSQRLAIYKQHALSLVETESAYYCFCSKDRLETLREKQAADQQPPRYDRACLKLSADEVATRLGNGEPAVIRLKVPDNEQIVFTDLIRGDISFESAQVDDQVLLKSDGYPTYHLAVVVDDYLMRITHVMRGEEWISSTPKHILLYKAFGWEPPIYAHIPIFLNPDGKGKMSKRKGTVSAQSFLDDGYLPEALLNFFMILGWAPADQREILSLDEYINEFDPKDISPKSVVFDLQKLAWLNGVYIRNLSMDQLLSRIASFVPNDVPPEMVGRILPLIAERLVKLSDFEELSSFFYREITVNPVELLKKSNAQEVSSQLSLVQQALESTSEWQASMLEKQIRHLQEVHEWKKSQFFMMLRIAVTGKSATPPLFETIEVIGKTAVLQRITIAQQLIGQQH